MLTTQFWQRAAQSLPASARERYRADLERAERIDLAIGALIDAWRDFKSKLRPRSGRARPA